jgi:hypothetical protein
MAVNVAAPFAEQYKADFKIEGSNPAAICTERK